MKVCPKGCKSAIFKNAECCINDQGFKPYEGMTKWFIATIRWIKSECVECANVNVAKQGRCQWCKARDKTTEGVTK